MIHCPVTHQPPLGPGAPHRGLFFPSDIELDRAEVAAGGFSAFVELAWPHVCAEPFVPNWHIDEITALLDQVARDRKNEISNEIALCVPPSSSKSKIASVLLQPWVWTWWPESCWISCTYEQDLASDLSSESLVLVQGDWYQERWPLEITKDAAKHWKNAKGGERRAVGTGGPITGKHAHFHLGDDLIKEQHSWKGSLASIVRTMQDANQFWFGTMITRKKGQAIARVLIGQRLHVDDPPGVAIRDHGYESVVFPLRYDPQRPDPRDHRTEEGELLCEARCDAAGVAELEASMTPSAAKAQLDQDPVPPGGQLLKDEYLSHRYDLPPGSVQRAILGKAEKGQLWGIYGDLTFKGKVTSDFVVFQVWCREEGKFWLVDQIRGQWGFLDTKGHLRDLCRRYSVAARRIRLEDAANAAAVEEDLRREFPGILSLPHGGGCLARVQQAEGIWASGDVMLPNAPWMGGGSGFVAEHLGFDGMGTRHDDQVSCSSLALLDLSSSRRSRYVENLRKIR